MNENMLAEVLAWPGVLLLALVSAALLAPVIGDDAAMIATGLLTAAVIHALERLLPFCRSWNENDGEIATDAAHIVMLALTDGWARGLVALWAARTLSGSGESTVLTPPALAHWWASQPLCVGVAAALLVGEVGGFASHWLLHVRSLPFWPLHRVHHAVRRLYILNTYRFHPLDLTLQILCIHPLIFLAGLGAPPILFWYTVFFNTVGQLSHCNVRTRCGVLNGIFNTPECHRHHHSRLVQEANCNYGQTLLIWDLAFGTYTHPRPPPTRIGDQLLSGAGVLANLTRPLREMCQVSRWRGARPEAVQRAGRGSTARISGLS